VHVGPIEVWTSAPSGTDIICTWSVVPRVIEAQPAHSAPSAKATKLRISTPQPLFPNPTIEQPGKRASDKLKKG
jgi:hypothetical protein